MVKKGCWVRAEYDKDSQHLHPNRYAEKAEVGPSGAIYAYKCDKYVTITPSCGGVMV